MATPIEHRGYAHPEALVSTDWVEQHLNDPKVRVVESNEDTLLYSSGHIPGAVHVDWTSDLNDQLRRDYISARGLRGADVEASAPRKDTTVVFYGDKNNWWACYAFWVFQLFGHTNAKVMDGGRVKWQKEGRALSRDVPATRRPSTRRRERNDAPHPRLPRRGARAPEEAGAARRRAQPGGVRRQRMHMPDYPNEGALRGGHIPGAKSVPWAKAINPDDGTFKTADELKKLYCEDNRAVAEERDDRLLPHRRAQQPHLVRAEVPARLRERPQLRRQLDGVGQPGRRADREVSRRSGDRNACLPNPAAAPRHVRRCSTTRRIARACFSLTRTSSRRCRRESRRGPSRRRTRCRSASPTPTSGR